MNHGHSMVQVYSRFTRNASAEKNLIASLSPLVQCAVVFCVLSTLFESVSLADANWKAGVAKAVITPQEPVWMAGYGGRTRPADGKLHELWIKVVAVEDATGHQAIVMSSDTLGISRTVYDNVCEAVQQKYGLDRSQIMLNSSHTHCGPVLRGALYDAYPIKEKEINAINKYSIWIEKTIVDTIGKALSDLKPASIEVAQGTATFGVNRRTNREAEVPKLREQNNLKGPVDHAVPVLAVKNSDGKLIAVIFGYACHNTTLSFYQWCGDYAGFAQYALEKKYPGAAALFYMGCGADQNPLPRRTVELCQGYGERLAAAVDKVLSNPMKSMPAKLETRHSFLTLNYGAEPTIEELTKMSQGSVNYRQRWAVRLLAEKRAGKKLERTYRYPLQAWKIGGEQLWITMGGEVVVDYSLGFKKIYGKNTWITGYCNDVMAYIPSLRVLEEGGYEGNTSMMVYGVPAHRWATDVETLIADEVDKLVKQLD